MSEVRLYGPGKFNTIVDSLIYTIVLDGFGTAELGDVQDFGHYDLIEFEPSEFVSTVNQYAREAGIEELNDAEIADYGDTVAAILAEDDQGFVHVDYYNSAPAARKEWNRLEAEYEVFQEEIEAVEEDEEGDEE